MVPLTDMLYISKVSSTVCRKLLPNSMDRRPCLSLPVRSCLVERVKVRVKGDCCIGGGLLIGRAPWSSSALWGSVRVFQITCGAPPILDFSAAVSTSPIRMMTSVNVIPWVLGG